MTGAWLVMDLTFLSEVPKDYLKLASKWQEFPRVRRKPPTLFS